MNRPTDLRLTVKRIKLASGRNAYMAYVQLPGAGRFMFTNGRQYTNLPCARRSLRRAWDQLMGLMCDGECSISLYPYGRAIHGHDIPIDNDVHDEQDEDAT